MYRREVYMYRGEVYMYHREVYMYCMDIYITQLFQSKEGVTYMLIVM